MWISREEAVRGLQFADRRPSSVTFSVPIHSDLRTTKKKYSRSERSRFAEPAHIAAETLLATHKRTRCALKRFADGSQPTLLGVLSKKFGLSFLDFAASAGGAQVPRLPLPAARGALSAAASPRPSPRRVTRGRSTCAWQRRRPRRPTCARSPPLRAGRLGATARPRRRAARAPLGNDRAHRRPRRRGRHRRRRGPPRRRGAQPCVPRGHAAGRAADRRGCFHHLTEHRRRATAVAGHPSVVAPADAAPPGAGASRVTPPAGRTTASPSVVGGTPDTRAAGLDRRPAAGGLAGNTAATAAAVARGGVCGCARCGWRGGGERTAGVGGGGEGRRDRATARTAATL